MYFVSTTSAGHIARGQLPLTAAEALAYVGRPHATAIDVRDRRGRKVATARLRKEMEARKASLPEEGVGKTDGLIVGGSAGRDQAPALHLDG